MEITPPRRSRPRSHHRLHLHHHYHRLRPHHQRPREPRVLFVTPQRLGTNGAKLGMCIAFIHLKIRIIFAQN